MIELLGTSIFIIGILGFFLLDRDGSVRTSKALWIPTVWLFLAGSRPVSLWLHIRMIGTSTDDLLEGSPLDRAVMTILIVMALIILLVRGPKAAKLLQASAPIFVFLIFCGVSILWSDFPQVALKRWIRAVGDIAMIAVVLTDLNALAAFERILARLAFVIVPLSILFDIAREHSGLEYHAGVATDKNTSAMTILVLGLACVWRVQSLLARAPSRDRTRRLIARCSILAMAVWCLWTAKSGTSSACFIVGTLMILFTGRPWVTRKPAFMHLLVTCLVSFALYAAILNPDLGVVSAMGKDPTLTGRTDVWQTVLRMAPNPWIGAGFESFWLGPRLKELWNIYVWRPNEAHNGYIEVYLNLGWAGLTLLAIILVSGYRKLTRSIRLDSSTGRLRLAYFVVGIVYSLTEAGFRMFSTVWILLLMSICAGLTLQPENSRSELRTVPGTFSDTEPGLSSTDSTLDKIAV